MSLNVKRESLAIKPDALGKLLYVGQETAPRQVDGKEGKYQRHRLASDVHGFFDVIAPAGTVVFEQDAEVRVIDPVLYPDRGVNGRDVAPALNVYAKGLEIVKGGK